MKDENGLICYFVRLSRNAIMQINQQRRPMWQLSWRHWWVSALYNHQHQESFPLPLNFQCASKRINIIISIVKRRKQSFKFNPEKCWIKLMHTRENMENVARSRTTHSHLKKKKREESIHHIWWYFGSWQRFRSTETTHLFMAPLHICSVLSWIFRSLCVYRQKAQALYSSRK